MGKGNKVGKTDLSEETYRKAIAMLMVPFAGKLMLFYYVILQKYYICCRAGNLILVHML